jgi:P4 family phage/plasmid primase-like protien
MDFRNLTLQKKESKLNNIHLNEEIDMKIMDKLLISDLLQQQFNYKHLNKIYENEHKQLTSYKNLIKENKPIIYQKSKHYDGLGRVQPNFGLGLINIRREIRQTLTKNIYIDIDIENCHVVILKQILEYNNIHNEELNYYINNRDNVLNLLMSGHNIKRDEAKNLMISIMYGRKYDYWIELNKNKECFINHKIDFVYKFQNSIKDINLLFEKYNPFIKDLIIKKNGNKNINNISGKITSLYLQEKENQILEEVYIYLTQKGIINNDCCLCYDGIMIKTNKYNDDLLIQLSDLIYNKFNIKLKFLKKDMKDDYLNILDKNLKFDFMYKNYLSTGLLSEYFRIIYDNFIFVNGNLYYYDNIRWIIDNDKKYTKLHNFVENNFYIHLSKKIAKEMVFINNTLINDEDKYKIEKEKIMNFLNYINKLKDFNYRKTLIEDICIHITNNDIEFDNYPFYFTFNNKIFDLENNKFIEPKIEYYISNSCGYNYNDFINKDDEILFNKLLCQIQPDEIQRKYYLQALSTSLLGKQIDKLFILTGKGGNGKSLMNNIMEKILGDYSYKLQSKALCEDMKTGANPEIAKMHNKRFIYVQEPDKDKKINSSVMKEITGSNTLNVRECYSNKTLINLKCSLFLECNNIPKIDEVNDAITRRIRIIDFPSKFLEKEKYDEAISQNINNVYLRNDDYKDNSFIERIRIIFINILFKSFNEWKNNNYEFIKCENVNKNTSDYMAISDDIFEWFKSVYEIKENNDDNIDDDIITFKDIYKNFSNSTFFNNLSKKDKREYNFNFFCEKINDNLFLQKYIMRRNKRYKKIQIKCDSIVKWIEIKKEDDFNNYIINNNDNFI